MMYSLTRDAKWLAWFEEMFTKVAGEDDQISQEDFKNVLKVSKVRPTLQHTSLIYMYIHFQ